MREILESRIECYSYPDIVYVLGPAQHRRYRYMGACSGGHINLWDLESSLMWPFFHHEAAGEVGECLYTTTLVKDAGP